MPQLVHLPMYLESYAVDVESEFLASQLKEALEPIFVIDDWISGERGTGGFIRGISVTGRNAALVEKLIEALKATGLEGISNKEAPENRESMLLLVSSKTKAKDVEAIVLVGVKPQPQH